MRRVIFPSIAACLVLVSSWGCGQQSPGNAAQAERLRMAEGTNAKLKEEAKLLAQLRDELREQLARGEAEQARLRLALTESSARRDELANDLKMRQAERDEYSGQYDGFRKGLRQTLDQADDKLATSPVLHPKAVAGTPAKVEALPVSDKGKQ